MIDEAIGNMMSTATHGRPEQSHAHGPDPAESALAKSLGASGCRRRDWKIVVRDDECLLSSMGCCRRQSTDCCSNGMILNFSQALFRTHVVYRNAVSTHPVYSHDGDDCAVKVGKGCADTAYRQ